MALKPGRSVTRATDCSPKTGSGWYRRPAGFGAARRAIRTVGHCGGHGLLGRRRPARCGCPVLAAVPEQADPEVVMKRVRADLTSLDLART